MNFSAPQQRWILLFRTTGARALDTKPPCLVIQCNRTVSVVRSTTPSHTRAYYAIPVFASETVQHTPLQASAQEPTHPCTQHHTEPHKSLLRNICCEWGKPDTHTHLISTSRLAGQYAMKEKSLEWNELGLKHSTSSYTLLYCSCRSATTSCRASAHGRGSVIWWNEKVQFAREPHTFAARLSYHEHALKLASRHENGSFAQDRLRSLCGDRGRRNELS